MGLQLWVERPCEEGQVNWVSLHQAALTITANCAFSGVFLQDTPCFSLDFIMGSFYQHSNCLTCCFLLGKEIVWLWGKHIAETANFALVVIKKGIFKQWS